MMTRMLRAIYFDAVGTLIHPQPSAAAVYAEVGARHGSAYRREQIGQRFAAAFQKQESLDRQQGWKTSEAREHERWRDIVAEVLDDVRDPAACFAELYEHFARPDVWICEPGATKLLATLQREGYVLGLASNYDHRLHAVVAGLTPLRGIQQIVISSEIGWRKPARGFFDALIRQASAPAEQILYVGDDRVNDYDGARAAGLQAVLVDPTGQTAQGTICSLAELSLTPRNRCAHPGA
jgi:putative hydrolase of the HAD superfamily